ncbi:hypothetical protein A0H81_02117 [Grifola frondosa]|uniref:Uncharacterized protein n=1 Tax=Grifola frondosa TaxID=5627 RepID=A0A1C7MM64_GRIFR|nr:hypothetical protein A0H81_02117 [Grifola frondosa]
MSESTSAISTNSTKCSNTYMHRHGTFVSDGVIQVAAKVRRGPVQMNTLFALALQLMTEPAMWSSVSMKIG